jgi:hypothetical protein
MNTYKPHIILQPDEASPSLDFTSTGVPGREFSGKIDRQRKPISLASSYPKLNTTGLLNVGWNCGKTNKCTFLQSMYSFYYLSSHMFRYYRCLQGAYTKLSLKHTAIKVCNKRTLVAMSVVQVFIRNLSSLCYFVAENTIFLSLFSKGILGMNSKIRSEAVIA